MNITFQLNYFPWNRSPSTSLNIKQMTTIISRGALNWWWRAVHCGWPNIDEVKGNLVGKGRVDTRVSQQGRSREGPAGYFQRMQPNRRSWTPSKSKRDTSSIKYSGDGKRKLYPVLLGQQDVGWQNQGWNFPTQNESGDKTGDQRQEVNKDPNAPGPMMHSAQWNPVKLFPNW